MSLRSKRSLAVLAVSIASFSVASTFGEELATDPAIAPVSTEAAMPPAADSPGASKEPAKKESGSDFGKSKGELTKLPKPADLKPTGPVTITAKRAELVQGSSATYTGNVVLDSDTIKLDGDRLELHQYPSSQYDAKLFGNPAHMSHASSGPDDPPMTAHAKTITYDSRTGIVDLVGEALVTKGDQKIDADTIHYDLTQNGVQANGGDGGQVHMVLPPAAPDTSAPKSAPSADKPATAQPTP